MALDLTGISNVNEFYSHHYLDALLESDLKGVLSRWELAEKDESRTPPFKKFSRCSEDYFKAKARVAATATVEDRFTETHSINVKLAEALGYEYTPGEYELIEDDQAVPVLASLTRDGNPYLWLLEAPFADEDNEPLKHRLVSPQMPMSARGDGYSFPLAPWEDLLALIFRREQPPRWLILLAGSLIFLVERHKWGQGKYLLFNVDDLLGRKQESALKATAALLARDCLCPDDGVVLHDSLDESSHKHAFAVSGDLKYGLRRAVELLANEYVWYQRTVAKQALFGNDDVARKLTVEALTFYTLDGKQAGTIQYPGIGAGSGILGRPEDKDGFYSFQSIISPPTVYHYDTTTGKSEVFYKSKVPFDSEAYELKEKNESLLLELRNAIAQLEQLSKGTIRALADALDAKCDYTSGHSFRVSRYAVGIAKIMGLPAEDIKDIELAGILHDIGKIGVPESILWKPGKLTDDEKTIMAQHPVKSAQIIGDLKGLERVRKYVLHHHEFMDGTGYPDGLVGEDIPLASRIVLAADAYDAMITDRPYRKAIGHERALDELRKYSGNQFDSQVVKALLSMVGENGELVKNNMPESFIGLSLAVADPLHSGRQHLVGR